jgi:hypothetical protein
MKGHKGRHHRKHGGHTDGKREDMVASGNPDVIKEAEGKESYAKDGLKKGGRAHHKKHHRKSGGAVQMTGGNVRPRLDRPGRKKGGRVGSDHAPLTSAHHTSSSESEPREEGGN